MSPLRDEPLKLFLQIRDAELGRFDPLRFAIGEGGVEGFSHATKS